MAIISFWSSREKETNQTSSLLASAIQMGIERNLKCLIIDANFNSHTISLAFEDKGSLDFNKNINSGRVDISSGMEGLLLAVKSNKTTPEIVKNYTKPILNGRLDVLLGLKTTQRANYENSLRDIPELINIANKYYDLIFVDLPKSYSVDINVKVLAMSDLIVCTFDQDYELIEDFVNLWGNDPLFSPKNRVIPLLTKEDNMSVYNCDNVARMIKMKPGMPSILYNTKFMDVLQAGNAPEFFISLNLNDDRSRNKTFLDSVNDLNMLIIERLEAQKYTETKSDSLVHDLIREHNEYNKKGVKTEEEKPAENDEINDLEKEDNENKIEIDENNLDVNEKSVKDEKDFEDFDNLISDKVQESAQTISSQILGDIGVEKEPVEDSTNPIIEPKDEHVESNELLQQNQKIMQALDENPNIFNLSSEDNKVGKSGINFDGIKKLNDDPGDPEEIKNHHDNTIKEEKKEELEDKVNESGVVNFDNIVPLSKEEEEIRKEKQEKEFAEKANGVINLANNNVTNVNSDTKKDDNVENNEDSTNEEEENIDDLI